MIPEIEGLREALRSESETKRQVELIGQRISAAQDALDRAMIARAAMIAAAASGSDLKDAAQIEAQRAAAESQVTMLRETLEVAEKRAAAATKCVDGVLHTVIRQRAQVAQEAYKAAQAAYLHAGRQRQAAFERAQSAARAVDNDTPERRRQQFAVEIEAHAGAAA